MTTNDNKQSDHNQNGNVSYLIISFSLSFHVLQEVVPTSYLNQESEARTKQILVWTLPRCARLAWFDCNLSQLRPEAGTGRVELLSWGCRDFR